ncbi:averantin oxidoreductase [Colletotrichum sublineola]|nr:averantin oxidoreductase [Colletotrichum sublineola]
MFIMFVGRSILSALTPYNGLLLFALTLVLTVGYYFSLAIYNIYFHPLSKYPGPRLAAATPWWTAYSLFRGCTPFDLLELHNRYGPVVRTAPDTLSYIKAPQWKEIYGHKQIGQPEFSKDEKYHASLKSVPLIINADREYHSYVRKLLAHGFSEKAMREQEDVLREYIDLMCRKLEEEGDGGKKAVDVMQWYNFLTFDFIGFLTFGESFDCLATSTLHTWIEIAFLTLRLMAIYQVIGRLHSLIRLAALFVMTPKKVSLEVKVLWQLENEKVKHRLKVQTAVPDFMDKLISAYNSGKMTFEQLQGNSRVLTLAGSETTATLLSGLTFLLLKNPRVLAKLTTEIRTTFAHPSDITFVAVGNCKYLLACIEEALRVYPPAPSPHTRIVPAGGATVDGEFLPEGTSVGIPHYAASHSPANWTLPEEFIPERWTGEDDRFAGDQREISQPFSFGPRNCIGKNLSYAEMRLVIARLLWQFDLEDATADDWIRAQKVFVVWEKDPVWVKLHPVRRG